MRQFIAGQKVNVFEALAAPVEPSFRFRFGADSSANILLVWKRGAP
jgi:hypothetical protein